MVGYTPGQSNYGQSLKAVYDSRTKEFNGCFIGKMSNLSFS